MTFTKTKKRRDSGSFLSFGGSVPPLLAGAILLGTALSLMGVFVSFASLVTGIQVARKETPTLVQLADGNVLRVAPLGERERTTQVIEQFVSETLVLLFNWDGLLPPALSDDPLTQTLDPGIEIQDETGKRLGRVTTGTWYGAWGLSEEGGFREEFVRELARLTPQKVFDGARVRVVLVPREFSTPKKIGENRWKVNFIGNLVTFQQGDLAGNATSFNKTVYLHSISSPQLPPPEAPELTQQAYQRRRAGLEITAITELEREDLQ